MGQALEQSQHTCLHQDKSYLGFRHASHARTLDERLYKVMCLCAYYKVDDKLMEKEKEVTKWIHCNSCSRPTEHLLVSRYVWSDSETIDDQYEISWSNGWLIWQCRGCKELTGETTYQFSEDIDYDGRPLISRTFYPERDKELIKAKSYINITKKIESLYEEIIKCFNNSCYLLCSIGLRTLIEGICLDKSIGGSNLYEKIENALFIPENIRKNLHGFRFLGNDAAHELNCPNKQDLQLAILVIEDILNVAYELDYKSKLIFDKFSPKQKEL